MQSTAAIVYTNSLLKGAGGVGKVLEEFALRLGKCRLFCHIRRELCGQWFTLSPTQHAPGAFKEKTPFTAFIVWRVNSKATVLQGCYFIKQTLLQF